jgi:hypothetical protein
VEDFKLVEHTYSDFDGDKENRVSTSRYLMSLGSTMSWRSHKQYITTYSTTEAKYVVVAEVTKKIVWLKKTLEGLQEKQVSATPLLIDNTYAIKLAKNLRFHD